MFFFNSLVLLFLLQFFNQTESKKSNLILVNVLFRHGERTPMKVELYPKDPNLNETFFPFGLGQLTNSGKQREYQIGMYLRKRYDKFLGIYYYPSILGATSTNVDRTKASLELVLAALFPPKLAAIWDNYLNWQPIPYNYIQGLDRVLVGIQCPYYLKLYNETRNSVQTQTKLNKYKGVLDYLSKNSGKNITGFDNVMLLYFGLQTEEEFGLELPQWTEKVWPEIMSEIAVMAYFVATSSIEMRRMASGYFLQKLIDDFEAKINGSDSEKKMNLYSAHEYNIADLLITLGVFDNQIPNYGAHLLFELHQIRNDAYGIMIFYQNYKGLKIQQIKLPDCEKLCELEKFKELYKEYIPQTDICIQN